MALLVQRLTIHPQISLLLLKVLRLEQTNPGATCQNGTLITFHPDQRRETAVEEGETVMARRRREAKAIFSHIPVVMGDHGGRRQLHLNLGGVDDDEEVKGESLSTGKVGSVYLSFQ